MDYYFIRWLLPVFLVSFFLFAVVLRAYVFWKRTGKTPFILGNTESPHGYVGRACTYLLILLGTVVGVCSVLPEVQRDIVLFRFDLEVQFIAVILLVFSLLITVIAQAQMGLSWRVGIETDEKTKIIQNGLYRFSRNPIYIGLYLATLGIFLLLPNPITLVILVSGHFVLQVLIRLEEAHMTKLHGDSFTRYCSKVRRWL